MTGMEIVAVERWLLELSAADEQESEAVALSCVEFLLAETNAYYQQRCLAREAVQAASTRLRDNILGAVLAAALGAEQPLDESRFQAEKMPDAEQKDRHAVRSVPLRRSEQPDPALAGSSSSPASRTGSSPDRPRVGTGSSSPTRRRRKVDKAERGKPVVAMPPIQTVERPPPDEDEKADEKEWRTKCLKDLEVATRKPGFSKWVTLARAFTVPETRVSMEVGVIAAPPAAVAAALAVTPVRMKTNVDSFSAIRDGGDSPESVSGGNNTSRGCLSSRSATGGRASRRPSAALETPNARGGPTSAVPMVESIAENPARQSKRRSQAGKPSDAVQQLQRRNIGVLLLNDALSRRKLARRPSASGSQAGSNAGGWSSSRSLWRYEHDAGSAGSQSYVADGTEFSAGALPSTMAVASGVVLSQGESVVEGPEWVEAASNMSRKRFDLHQRLAADALLNAPPERDRSLNSRTSSSSSSLGSPLYHHAGSPGAEPHFRDYEEVPAEPITMPQLSPIATSSLAIPRTHLAASLSTPSLRVRTTVASGKAGGSFPVFSDGDGEVRPRSSSTTNGSTSLNRVVPRPSTALRALAAPVGRARAKSAEMTASASVGILGASTATPGATKYLREFPKPRAGVIRVVDEKAASLASADVDERQRLAWMS